MVFSPPPLFFYQHREEDYNKDGKHDELLMTIKIPLQREKILSVKLLLIYDYKLHVNICILL